MSQPPSKKAKLSQSELHDPHQLAQLFSGSKDPHWKESIIPIINTLPDAARFISPTRSSEILPVRELTFQAIKPNAPADWRVIVFGQSPYPNVQSATGIAMFNNKVKCWFEKAFSRATSMRCLIKAAAISKYAIQPETKVADLRKLLASKKTVQPAHWFQAMLQQGVLLLNASLTTGEVPLPSHNTFWRPVILHIVQEILRAKANLPASDHRRGLLMLWWGVEAKKIRSALRKILAQYSSQITIRDLTWYNPAAQRDLFCQSPPHFTEVNRYLEEIGQAPIDWLPDEVWLQNHGGPGAGVHGQFITKTQELHKMYLERLQSGLERVPQMEPIRGVMDVNETCLIRACEPLGLSSCAKHALATERVKSYESDLSNDEKGAIYMYTGGGLYSEMNEALRSPDRSRVRCYFPFLSIFIRAHSKLDMQLRMTRYTLYRGISKDLFSSYRKGETVVWWSVSSCTQSVEVAMGFGSRTLFRITAKRAVSIIQLSAISGEDEYILAPGTQLKVVEVEKKSKTSRTKIFLEEIEGDRLVT